MILTCIVLRFCKQPCYDARLKNDEWIMPHQVRMHVLNLNFDELFQYLVVFWNYFHYVSLAFVRKMIAILR